MHGQKTSRQARLGVGAWRRWQGCWRQHAGWTMAGPWSAVALALLCAAALCGLLMAACGVDAWAVYARLAAGVLGNSYGAAQVLYKATPLIFTGLAVALASRAGLFNLGAEGQMICGGLLCAYVGTRGGALPQPLLVALCLLAAFVGGALWAAVPALFKARGAVDEVVSTIMLNFVAAGLANFVVMQHFHVAETVHTPAILASAQLPRLAAWWGALTGAAVNAAFLLAVAAAGVVAWLLWRTTWGYEWRAVGVNQAAARAAGIGVERCWWLVLLCSGGLAGLAATNYVLGHKHYYEDGFSGGAGYWGIAVALLGQNHPLWLSVAALFFGALAHGSLVINALVPKDILLILQAVVLIFLLVAQSGRARRWAAP